MSFPSLAVLQQATPDSPAFWPTLPLGAATVATGLSAGIFTAFQVAIVPGLKRVNDDAYVSTFQAINRAILNPAFLSLFVGAPILLAVATASWWREDRAVAAWLGAALVLQVANLAITIGGNVPLNEALDRAGIVAGPAATAARTAFEGRWNRLHTVRTVASVASTVALGFAAVGAIRR
jgi:uncharacterized membrane protein